MPLGFDWVDAFSAQPFGGNGCAVVYDAAGLPDSTCQAIVAETGLVECTFLGPSNKADLHIRYFMANREIPFAGHPTVATVASLVDRGLAGTGTIRVETGAGIISVDVKNADGGAPEITMTQVRPEFGPRPDTALVAEAVGLEAADIIHPPQVVSTGLPMCITVLKDQETLRRAALDPAALGRFRDALGVEDGDVLEPFLVTLGGISDEASTFSRLLLAPPLPPEDPFTGSATGAMAAYLWSNGLIDAPDFIAEQGHWMGRPGQAKVSVIGPADDISGVRVSGTGYVLMRGFLNLT